MEHEPQNDECRLLLLGFCLNYWTPLFAYHAEVEISHNVVARLSRMVDRGVASSCHSTLFSIIEWGNILPFNSNNFLSYSQ